MKRRRSVSSILKNTSSVTGFVPIPSGLICRIIKLVDLVFYLVGCYILPTMQQHTKIIRTSYRWDFHWTRKRPTSTLKCCPGEKNYKFRLFRYITWYLMLICLALFTYFCLRIYILTSYVICNKLQQNITIPYF